MTLFSFHWVDWVMLAVLLLSVVVGLWRGLMFEIMSLVGWVAAYVAALASVSAVAPLLPVGTPGGALNQGVAFTAVFVIALVIWALSSRVMRMLIHATQLQAADRALGAGFGLLRGAVLLLALATVVSLTPAAHSPAWHDSQGAAWLGLMLHELKPVLPESLAQHLPA